MVELRASGAQRADSEAVEGIGTECFAAVIGTLGANVKEPLFGLLWVSGAMEKVRFFPGERLGAMA